MAYDPSVLSDIAPNAVPDVVGAQGKALTLADLYDTNTLNKMKVGEAKQNQADMTYAKQILAGKDLSKLEDQNSAVAEITKRSPQLGMQLARDFSSQRSDTTKERVEQLDLYKAKNDLLGADLQNLKAKHDQIIEDFKAKNPKATPEQLEQATHDAMQNDVIDWVTRTSKQTLPDGSPLLNAQDKAMITAGLGRGYSASWVDSMVNKSAEGRAAIVAKLKERDEDRKEKATNAAITAGERRGDQTDRKITDAERAAKTKTDMEAGERLQPEDASWMAGQYLAGDKSVLTGLGRGKQGPQNIIAVRHEIAQQAKDQGMKPADVAARLAEYSGYVSEQRALGTQQANVESASSEAQQMITNAREASAAVPRSEFLPWTKLSQASDTQLNNPKLASLKAATQAVLNTWARAINPKGAATVADKEHGEKLLNAAQSQEAFNAVLDRFQQETEASLAAPQGAKARLHQAFLSGQTPEPVAAPGPGSLQPTPGRGAPPGGGPAAPPPADTGGWGQATVVSP